MASDSEGAPGAAADDESRTSEAARIRTGLALDTSAVVSIVIEENGYGDLVGAVVAAPSVVIGAPTLFEAEMVLASKEGASGLAVLALFLARNEVTAVPFDDNHRRLATAAFVRYGKGRHPAALNYGDCMTYATARLSGAPLLFVGDDFAKTDLTPAVAGR